MSASVYLACKNATNGVSNQSAPLVAEPHDDEAPRALRGMLILGKTSVPLYAIRQAEAEPADAGRD